MGQTAALNKSKLTFQDVIALLKPNIILFCILMSLGGLALAIKDTNVVLTLPELLRLSFWLCCGSGMSVASSGAINQYLEREFDKKMARTATRPLPMGKISPNLVLASSLALQALSFITLWKTVNETTAWISLFAFISYSFIYTPLKQLSPYALVVGAVPGAIPPLLGWTALTDNLSLQGFVLFGILFFWQIPHFVAIAITHKRDYAKAGFQTVTVVWGNKASKFHALIYTLMLVPTSLMLVLLNLAGSIYLTFAVILGIWFSWLNIKGFLKGSESQWARKFFFASLVYLVVLTFALIVDVMVEMYI